MSNKPDRIPALDPAQPGIYRRILDTAKEVREQRQNEARALMEFQLMVRRMQLQQVDKVEFPDEAGRPR